MEVIFILLFSTIQVGFGGLVVFSRLPTSTRSSKFGIVGITLGFLILNVATLLHAHYIGIVIELVSAILPPTLLLHYTVLKRGEKQLLRLNQLVFWCVFYGFVTSLCFLFARLNGISIVVISPVLLFISSVIGFVPFFRKTMAQGQEASLIVLVSSGMVIALLGGALVLDRMYSSMQLTSNTLFFVFVLEHFLGERGSRLKSKELGVKHQNHDLLTPAVPLENFNLTKTERIIANGLLLGWDNQQIADHLDKSVPTIHKHLSNLYSKTNH